jgi:fatty-acyl-CoA synthase
VPGLVTDAVAYYSRCKPDAPAIIFGDVVLPYREFWDRVLRVADHLQDNRVDPGDVVGIVGENCVEWCVGAIGAMAAGAAVATYNHRFVAAELAKLIENSAPRVVFSDDAHVARLDEVRSAGYDFEIMTFDTVAALPASADAERRAIRRTENIPPTAPTLIIYTSGTTGTPKGVVHTHETIKAIVMETALLDGHIESRRLCVLPLATSAGIFSSLLHQLIRGGTVILQPDFQADAALEAVLKYQVSWISGPPIVFERLSQVAGFKDADLSSVRFATVGGARVPTALMRAWQAKGVVLRQLYGCTETGGFSTLAAPDEALARPESCGNGGVYTALKVVRPDGRECDPEELGEILIKGPGLTPGYYRDEAATAEAIVNGWLHTGDLGIRLPGGGIIFKDRFKELIISGGINVSPREIEEVISEYPGVLEVAVIPVPDAKFGETVAALVYADPVPEVERLVEHCNANLADFKVPRYVEFLDAPFPRLPSGKLNRMFIKKHYASLPETRGRVR